MSAKFSIPVSDTFAARIKVVGVGGGGGNAINSMIMSGIDKVEFVAANTDIQHLNRNMAGIKVQLGGAQTRGLGAGSDPEVGRKAAEQYSDELTKIFEHTDMVFIAAGMGGGTGTGASPVIAKIARECGALTVAVVTKPFPYEGKRRMNSAIEGIERLKEEVDALLVIPNERLLSIGGRVEISNAFKLADNVLCNAVRGISELITNSGHINVDFADVKNIMSNKGMALMGTGVREGDNRAVLAAQDAISSPLLDNVSIQGARGVLVNICSSSTFTLDEYSDAAALIQEAAHEDANIKCGLVIDESLGDSVKVTVIATAFDDSFAKESPAPVDVPRLSAEREKRMVQEPAKPAVNHDIPTFIRREQKAAGGVARLARVANSHAPAEDFDDKYSMPTFLRKQAD